MNKIRWLIGSITGLATIGLALLLFRPEPIPIEVGKVTRGSITVTVNEDGRTRIKDKYIVSSPVGGRLRRLIHREGDPVSCSQTILASIEPGDPSLLDARAFAEATARVSAAQAAIERAQTRLEQAIVETDRAEKDYQRGQNLVASSSLSQKELDALQAAYYTSLHSRRSADFERDIARYELQMAEAALLHVRQDQTSDAPPTAIDHFNVLAPIDGVILRVFQESATIVTPGTPIVEVGDPRDLEVIVDVRSEDATKIIPGATVFLEQWGGDSSLSGIVSRIEPSAFEKISALGIEEQRVNVIIDFENEIHQTTNLGDGYRVEARVVVWQAEETLRIPVGALFRHQNQWAAYRYRQGSYQQGRAELVTLQLGPRDDQFAQVLDGLSESDQVILHPSDKISDQSRVLVR